jgi:hypothetical protein
MGAVRDYLRSSKGQTIIEFALVTPIILLLLVGIIDFGMAMNRRIVLQHAAREGARMAAVSEDMSGICSRTVDQAHGAIDGVVVLRYTNLNASPGYDSGDDVTVTLPAHWDLPILNSALPALFHLPTIAPISLTATGSARLEGLISTVPAGGEYHCPSVTPVP